MTKEPVPEGLGLRVVPEPKKYVKYSSFRGVGMVLDSY